MRVFIYGLNTCEQRNVVIKQYRDYLLNNNHEIVSKITDANVVLIWTCAFREDFKNNSIAEIIRLKIDFSGDIVVSGCLPAIDRGLLDQHFDGCIINWKDGSKEIETYFGAPNKGISEINLDLSKTQIYSDENIYREQNPDADVFYVGRYNQINISEGCIWECSYCSERIAFPPFKSYPLNDIIDAIHFEVARSGSKAIALLGDCVGDYGIDTGTTFSALLNCIQEEIADVKIALLNFNPYHFIKFYDCIVDLIKRGVIVHIQLPYQSASDKILKLMKRPYNREDIEKAYATLNELKFMEFDGHMIVGFPGETEDDFHESVEFGLKYHPNYILINSFMEQSNMPASYLSGKVSADTKRRRLLEAEQMFRDSGIICNSNEGSLAKERFRKWRPKN